MQTIPYDLIKWTARDRAGNTINRVLYPGAYVLVRLVWRETEQTHKKYRIYRVRVMVRRKIKLAKGRKPDGGGCVCTRAHAASVETRVKSGEKLEVTWGKVTGRGAEALG